jgi:ion channel POLLUX/CASTOR
VDNEGPTKMSWIDRDHGSAFINSGKWNLAPTSAIVAFALPLFLFKYIDQLRHRQTNFLRVSSSEEEVPLKKRIAYKVDVFFSGHPYAKLLALLLATIILIASGGIALFAVSGSGFLEALWLSWTFVADSGNHADQVGLGPRIVSVSISSGGMLVFATMLGLVSDAISEKVDSWRKGKSEVIENNHILILGWSDKLVKISDRKLLLYVIFLI